LSHGSIWPKAADIEHCGKSAAYLGTSVVIETLSRRQRRRETDVR
jgi:hypothetical protein